MSAKRRPKAERTPLPWVAVGITVVLSGIAVDQQLTAGKVDRELLGVLVILVFFWAGQGVDRLLERWFG